MENGDPPAARDEIPDSAAVLGLIARARLGDEALVRIVERWANPLIGKIRYTRNCVKPRAVALLDRLWQEKRREICVPADAGGYGSGPLTLFHEWLFERFDLAGTRGSTSTNTETDSPSPALGLTYDQTVLEDLRLVRDGDDAFESLKARYQPRLASVLAKAGPYDWPIARQNAEACFEGYRQQILSPPDSGGYWPPSHGELTTFIIRDCLQLPRRLEPTGHIPFNGDIHIPVSPPPSDQDAWNPMTPDEIQVLISLALSPETGYPHQQLAFLFAEIAYGPARSGDAQGDPQRVDEKHGNAPLLQLSMVFERWYRMKSLLSQEQCSELRSEFELFRVRLAQTVKELRNPKDQTFKKRHRKILKRIAGETCLRDYYPPDPTVSQVEGNYPASLKQWSIIRRIREIIQFDASALKGFAPDTKITVRKLGASQILIRTAQKMMSDWCFGVKERIRALLAVARNESDEE